MALSFEMKKKVFQTLSRGDKSCYCVSMNKSDMLQILKKMTWLIPTVLLTINMQSLTIHLCQTNTFILPNPLHNILKISSGHGISNNVISLSTPLVTLDKWPIYLLGTVEQGSWKTRFGMKLSLKWLSIPCLIKI